MRPGVLRYAGSLFFELSSGPSLGKKPPLHHLLRERLAFGIRSEGWGELKDFRS